MFSEKEDISVGNNASGISDAKTFILNAWDNVAWKPRLGKGTSRNMSSVKWRLSKRSHGNYAITMKLNRYIIYIIYSGSHLYTFTFI